MLQSLFLSFLIVPLVEIYLLIKVGGLIGAGPTVFMVVFTAVLGAFLIRLQGISTMNRVREMLMRGEIPAIEVMEGLVLLVSGALLLTPGFFTDTLGFLGLVPPLRRHLILSFLRHQFPDGGAGPFPDSHNERPPRSRRTIEGECWKDDDRRL